MRNRWTAIAAVLTLSLFSVLSVRSEDDPAKAVVAKALQAHGGAEKLAQFKGIRLEVNGTIDIQGNAVEFSARTASRYPDHYRLGVNVAGNVDVIVRVLTGTQGWQRLNGETKELQAEELAELKAVAHQIYLRSLIPLQQDPACRVSWVGEVAVRGRPTLAVRAAAKGQAEVNLYFAKDTGLLVKTERRGLNFTQEEGALETFYDNYKEVQGLKYPHALVVHHEGKEFMKQEVTQVRFEERIDDSEFGRP